MRWNVMQNFVVVAILRSRSQWRCMIYISRSILMIYLLGLMVHHPKLECPVKNWIALYKVKVTMKVWNVNEFMSGWYLWNQSTFCNQTWYGGCIIMSWNVKQLFLLSSRWRPQWKSKYDCFYVPSKPLQRGAADAKLKSHLVRTQSLIILPLRPGVGLYMAIHATLTARDFISTLLVHSPCIFSKTSPNFFPVLAVANTGSCVGPQNKIGHHAGCRFPCWVPAEYKKAQKT